MRNILSTCNLDLFPELLREHQAIREEIGKTFWFLCVSFHEILDTTKASVELFQPDSIDENGMFSGCKERIFIANQIEMDHGPDDLSEIEYNHDESEFDFDVQKIKFERSE